MAGPSNPSSPPAKSPVSPAKSSVSPTKSPFSPASATASSPIAETGALVADEHPEEDRHDLGIEVGAESDTTSLRSSIFRYREENGRTYHAYKDGSYVIPNDDAENDRMELQHTLCLLTFDDRLHVAPLTAQTHRVLDAGCGTGVWSIEYADEHPESHVTGVDLSPIQPAFVPPNCHFFIDDVEDDWNFSAPFDFIYSRFLTGAVKDWPRFFKQAYDNLNPGGTLELLDIILPLECDDNTLAADSALNRWSKLLDDAFAGNGSALRSALRYEQELTEIGFVDVGVVREKWPTNRWPKDKKYKQIGIWNQENVVTGLGALTLALFTRPEAEKGLGWSREEVELLLAGVRKDTRNTNIHAYYRVDAVYARKPN